MAIIRTTRIVHADQTATVAAGDFWMRAVTNIFDPVIRTTGSATVEILGLLAGGFRQLRPGARTTGSSMAAPVR